MQGNIVFSLLRKGPRRPQKLNFELFWAVVEPFRALFGLENGPPEPPGEQAKTGPQHTRHRPRGDPGAHFGPKKASKRAPNQYCFGWTFWCLKMTLQATCLDNYNNQQQQTQQTTLHSYRSCLTCFLHDLATTPLSHHAFKKRGRRHGGEAL